jgi:hypothetical protein
MRLFRLAVCIALVSGLFHEAAASGFRTLDLGADARSASLGLTSLSADPGANGYWNPAGLVAAGNQTVIGMHRWFEDVQSGFLGIGMGNGRQGFGFNVLYTGIGGMEYRLDQPTPEPIGTFSAHEWSAGVSYGRIISGSVSAGMTFKLLHERIFIHETTGWGIDLGAAGAWNGFQIAGTIQNIGRTGKLNQESIDLPLTARIGVGRFFGSSSLGRFWTVAEAVARESEPVHLHAGVEYDWRGLALRMGYQTGYDTRGLTAGLGLAWGRTKIDYAYMPFSSGLGDSHRFSVGLTW